MVEYDDLPKLDESESEDEGYQSKSHFDNARANVQRIARSSSDDMSKLMQSQSSSSGPFPGSTTAPIPTSGMDPKQYDALDRCIAMAIESIQSNLVPRVTDQFSISNMLAVPMIQPLSTKVTNRSYLLPFPKQVPAQTLLRLSQGSLFSAAVRRVHVTPWPQQQAGKRHRALQTWRIIVEEGLSCTTLGRQLHDIALHVGSDQKMMSSVEDSFTNKSTSTLERRGACFLKFLVWHRSNFGTAGVPLIESRCYEYIKHLQEAASPTSPSSFRQAINFSWYVLKMQGAQEVTDSARIRGVVYASMGKKRARKQSRHLSVEEVKSLEFLAQKCSCKFDIYAALFFIACMYARSRFTGMCMSENVIADLDENDDGFIETGTKHSKVHRTAEQTSLWLPLVAPAVGITGFKWGRAFLKEREEQKLTGFRYLLPTPGANGCWIDEPTEVGDASRWLRDLLEQAGHDINGVATHSLKVTPLTWASKFSSPLDIQALMGYHVSKEITSTMCYSRDAQSAPLAELTKIIQAIRVGDFCPDLTRSGRILSKHRRVEQKPEQPVANLPKAMTEKQPEPLVANLPDVAIEIPCVSDPYVVPPEPVLSSSSSSSSSSDSGSEVSAIGEDQLEVLRKVRLPRPVEVEEMNAYVHRLSQVLHAKRVEAVRLNCGRILSKSYDKFKWADTAVFLRCSQCFRGDEIAK